MPTSTLTDPTSRAAASTGAPPRHRSLRKAGWIVCAAWAIICVVQFGAGLSDSKLHAADEVFKLMARVLLANAPLAAYCFVQYALFNSPGAAVLEGRRAASAFALGIVLFLLPFGMFESTINPIILGPAPWSSVWQQVAAYPALYWSFDFLIFAGCFSAALAASVWQSRLAAERERDERVRENLALRLSLEQQQMRALQAQLEPHFLFNALNAISALVRAERTRDALSAIGTLSTLLRHAVAASHDRWTTLGQELDFIRDYLGLQRLRHDDRLVVTLPELTPAQAALPIPALLLQPLVENAIRHDLERHADTSRLFIDIRETSGDITITVGNPLRDAAPTNPGSGLGLPHTRERLALMYGPAAACEVSAQDGWFNVALRLPMRRDD